MNKCAGLFLNANLYGKGKINLHSLKYCQQRVVINEQKIIDGVLLFNTFINDIVLPIQKNDIMPLN